MNLLNIYYTEESSVLTEGEMAFTLYAIGIWRILRLCSVISSGTLLDIVTLCLACQTLEPEDQGRFQGGHL